MKQAHAKIALLHHTGGGNLGDDATMDAVIHNIHRRWPTADITAFSMNPGDTGEKHKIPSHPIRRQTWDIGYNSGKVDATKANKNKLFRWLTTTRNPAIRFPIAVGRELAFLIASLRILRSFDLLAVSGGGQLTERSGPWGFPYAIFIWILMARAVRIKCVFLNVGAGPLIHPLSKLFVTHALFAADYVSFRDEQSQTLAKDIGFTGKSQVFPDNVYSLEVSSFNISSGRKDCPIVGIAPMPYPFCDPREHPSGHQEIYDEFIAKFATFSSSLVRNSRSLELFGSDTGADPASIEDLRSVLLDRHNISTPHYVPVDSVGGLLLKMSAMDYVVTCRFHGVVFAHILNKPVLAISHHPKVANLMNALGLEKYCVNIRTFDPIRLAETFESLVSDTEWVKRRMAANLADYSSKLATQFDSLFPPDLNPEWMPQAGLIREAGASVTGQGRV